MAGVINWFEIPAADVDRATGLYTAIIGATFERSAEHPDNAFFVHEGGTGGEVSKSDGHVPSDQGVRIYLYAPNGVADALTRVERAGGSVALGKTEIGPHGFIAHVIDTEGNRVGLHNMQG